MAAIYHNIGGLEHARSNFRGRLSACEARLLNSPSIARSDHIDTVAGECASAGLLDGLGRYAESRPIYLRALEIFERHYDPEHFEIAATPHILSAVDAAEGLLESVWPRATRAR